MNAAQLGLEPGGSAPAPAPAPLPSPAPAPAPAPAPSPDTSPKKEPGTEDPKPSPAPTPENPDGGAPADPKDKRISDLMGKWQSEEHEHKLTKSELELYRERFGPLDPNNPASAPRPAAPPAVREGASPGGDEVPAALKPGWKPETMEEFQAGLKEIAEYGARLATAGLQSEQQAREAAEKLVDEFVKDVKAADPEFDDKVFFAYATKYNFPMQNVNDLRSIYRSYVDHTREVREAEARGAKKRENRETPVDKPGGGGAPGSGVDFKKISSAHNATDLVHDALHPQQ